MLNIIAIIIVIGETIFINGIFVISKNGGSV
jgi:hypothetical protein